MARPLKEPEFAISAMTTKTAAVKVRREALTHNVWWPLQGGPRTQLVADCTHGRGHLDWKRGEVVPRTKVAITLETKPGNKPGTNKLESRLGTGARPQGTATCRPHASISKLAQRLAYCLRPRQAGAVGNALVWCGEEMLWWGKN